MPLAPWQAAIAGIVALALGWIVYDLLCKSPIAKSDCLLALVGFGYVVLTSYVFTLIFSGRGALIHTGALMATMMTANVFFIIMPNQRKSIAALIAGETPDPEMGQGGQAALDAQQLHHAARAVHDAVEPLSRDLCQRAASFPALVTLVIIAGALVRYFYNMWHGDHDKAPWWAWFVAAVAIWAAFWVCMAASPGMRDSASALAPAPPVAHRLGRTCPKRRPMSSMSFRRAVRCAIRPSPCSKALARRRRACFSIRPSISPHSRRRSATQAVMTPCDAAQQHHRNDAAGARRSSPDGSPATNSRRTEKAPGHERRNREPRPAPDGAPRRIRALQRRRRPPDAPLSLQRASASRPAIYRLVRARSALPQRSTPRAMSGRVTKASSRARRR